jgi:hypothetical protein
MISNPKIYEINTRVWLKRFDTSNEKATLSSIPISYWNDLKKKGFDFIWLMGIWKTCDSVIEGCCFQTELVNSYDKALKNWSKEDVIGSPYAIDLYEVNPLLGTEEDLFKLRQDLQKLNMKLILDFIPNHFNADSIVKRTNPEIFLQSKEEHLANDKYTFFKSKYHDNIVFVHGRDPFFPAWTDTVQVNYFSSEARNFMIDTLRNISSKADAVRCDMAMLVLNNVFHNTWRGVIDEEKYPRIIEEFWKDAIESVKKINPDFIFIAEAYWNLEWDLQQIGFDFTYDKKLLDRLKDGTSRTIRDHLKADKSYQIKSVRFIENHDEERSITSLGIEKSFAAAILISTIQGMRLFHDGQFEGRRIKLPVQLGKEPNESVNKQILKNYEKLFSLVNNDVFNFGDFELLEPLQVWERNFTNDNLIAYNWVKESKHFLVVINYSNVTSQCRLKLDVRNHEDNFELIDVLNDKTYIRSAEEVFHIGLFIELAPWHSHIFLY